MNKPSSVFTNTLFQILGKIVTLFLGLATTAIIYRTLGTGEYGVYVFVTSFVLLFATISDWGTEIITIREASQRPKSESRIFGTAIILRLVLSLFALILANLVIRLFPSWQEFVVPVTIFSLALIGVAMKTSAGAVFLTKRVAIWGAAAEVLNNGLYFIGILALMPNSPHLTTALNILIFATFIAGSVSLFWASRAAPISFKLHPGYGRILLREALPTGALLTTFYIYNRADVIILQHFKGNEAVGFYGLAYKIHDNLVQGAAFLMNAVFPLIAANLAKEKFQLLYQRAFHILLGGGCLLAIIFFVGAPFIINLLGGPSASPSVIAMRILVFATAVAYLNHLTGYTLIAIGHQRASFFFAIAALLFNLVGNIFLIPRFSYIAASFMTVATEVLVFILSSVAIFRYTNTAPSLNNFFKSFILGIKTRGQLFEHD